MWSLSQVSWSLQHSEHRSERKWSFGQSLVSIAILTTLQWKTVIFHTKYRVHYNTHNIAVQECDPFKNGLVNIAILTASQCKNVKLALHGQSKPICKTQAGQRESPLNKDDHYNKNDPCQKKNLLNKDAGQRDSLLNKDDHFNKNDPFKKKVLLRIGVSPTEII